jgi:hypothetical protein
MGQGPSVGFITDTMSIESFRKDNEHGQRMVGRAFAKCVEIDPLEKFEPGETQPALSAAERQCIGEYTLTYCNFAKAANQSVGRLYEQNAREMYEKAMREQMAAQKGK